MENELNLDVLKERIQQEQEKSEYYRFAVEMLIKKYEASKFFTREELGSLHSNLPDEFLDEFMAGEVSDETYLLLSIDDVDNFVQSTISLIWNK